MPNTYRVFMMFSLAVASLAALPIRAASAQLSDRTTPPTAQELAARIDSVVKTDVLPRGFPSVSIVVTRGSRILLERAWGVANVDGRRAEPSTIYNIASMTKQFTAALVLKLVDRGTLSLTDPVARHLNGLPREWNSITIEQLLNHTSGLARDFEQQSGAAEHVSGSALVAMAARDTLVSKPGTAYAYSNTGYMLLGVLVEQLYRSPYGVALHNEIARPLGLESLSWCEGVAADRAATGYIRTSDGKVIPQSAQHPSQNIGAAGICSSATDIAKWNQALHGGRVLSPASYAAMITPRGAAIGKYGFGLVPRTSPWNSPAIVHDGQLAGFSSHNAWFPADSLSVTLLYNALPRLEVAMADFVALIAIGGKPRPIPPMVVIELPVAATQGAGRPRFVGAYEIGAGRLFIVSFEDGQLYVTPPGGSKQRLSLQSGTTYVMGSAQSNTTVTFTTDADGTVTGFTARADGVDRRLVKVK